jgi:superkiller protein 3
VRAEIVGALEDWASLATGRTRQAWLLAVARGADPDPWRDRLRQPELWQDGAALTRLAGEVRAAELSPQLTTALGRALRRSGGDAEPLLTAAQARFPNDFWLNINLGGTLHDAKRWDDALGYFRAALALRPEAAVAHFSLGLTLKTKGRLDEAIEHYRHALRLDPNYPKAHNNLGTALRAKGRVDAAIEHYQHALRLDPKYAIAHYNLGNALDAKGRVDAAIEHYQHALRLDPKDAKAHNNLGNALKAKGRLDEAIEHYRHALRLDPKYVLAHNSLGSALQTKGRLDEAMEHYQHALRLDPKYVVTHYNLGTALETKGRLDEAMEHYRHALLLDPKYALAHNGLGNALKAEGRLDEAIEHYRHALQLDPKDVVAHTNLSHALLQAGRFQEARAATRQWLDLLPEGDPRRAGALQRLQQGERLLALEARLPALLEGKEQPADAAEQRDLAALCQNHQRRYAAAARFYAAAFAAQPKLADDLQTRDRYNAACAAALAGGGQGADSATLDDTERARWRKQALDWLRADLTAWTHATDAALVQKTLKHWQQDTDFASVRGPEALAPLPPAERVGWMQLWAEVADLLQKTGGRK